MLKVGGINWSGPQRKLYGLGADIGGTFTDIVLLGEDGKYWTKKVSSTPKDYSVGIVGGLLQLFFRSCYSIHMFLGRFFGFLKGAWR